MTRKALVTGGLGFIGSHLSRRLLERDPDLEVTIVDNLSGTKLDWSRLEGRANIVIGDLRDLTPATHSFDQVWHLASPVGSVGILSATGHLANDILGLAEHAHELAAANRATLIYVSTSEVYGRHGCHQEGTELIVPHRRGARMEYALGKLTAEHVLANRSIDADVPLRIVRPFNCAGPGQSTDLGFVVPTFVRAALDGLDLPVHGDGTARRAFCHVDDMVEGLISVAERGRPGELYNVGQPDEGLTIAELAMRVIRRLGSSSLPVHVDPFEVFGRHWIEAYDKIPDIRRVTSETGWRPHRTLDHIIDDVAADIRRER